MIRKSIPNFLTSMNIVCGTIAIAIAFENKELLHISAILIGIASVFDFLDGFSARMLKAYSPMGKELDSLADMISFGLAPTIIMYQMIKFSLFGTAFSFDNLQTTDWLFILSPLLIAVFSGLRLAKFNIDTRQTDSFIGLPTPANAIFIASIPVVFWINPDNAIITFLMTKWALLAITVIFSFLLVSEIPMFSLKIKNLKFADNKLRFVFIGLVLVLIISFQVLALPLIIILYILLSVINALFANK